MPVSTPQLSSPRCLIASTVGLLPGPSCAAAIPVQPTPSAAAATTAIPRRLPIISLPPSSVLVRRPVHGPYSTGVACQPWRRFAQKSSRSLLESGPGRSLPRIRPSIRLAGMIPPAVVARKISSASSNSAAGSGRASQGTASSSQSSNTDRRVIPSSTPRSGVTKRPAVTANRLKPGPSVTLPSSSRRTGWSAPRSWASNRAEVRSAQWKFLTRGSTLAGRNARCAGDR